jgi:ABC-type dipeptide/oligopeptide/nickel transport system permease subunit/ABC-type transport system substrate-binding protein
VNPRKAGWARRVWAELWSDGGARVGIVLLALLVVFAVVGPWLIGADPNHSDFRLSRSPLGGPPGPSFAHPLGSDALFRDVLARLAAGARLSLAVALGATLLATLVGTSIGVVSGYFDGRAIDRFLTGLVDVALAFPFLLLITAIGVAVTQTDATSVTLILGLTGWPAVARVVRAKTRPIGHSAFVAAARALGASHLRLLWRHVLPGLRGTLLVLSSQIAASMILAEAVLGYLTVGIPPPQASLGRMLYESEHFIGVSPLHVAAPAVAILLVVLSLTRIADALSDALDETRTSAPKRRAAYADLLILAAAGLLLGFSAPAPLAPPTRPSPADPSGPHAAGGGAARRVLRLASHVRVYHLDPALAYDEASRRVFDMTLARLVRFDDRGTPQPQLAKSFSLSADGLRYRFELREGLQFHDGTPLAAADVKRSLERTLHPKTACPGAELFSAIAGFAAYRAGKRPRLDGVRVVAVGTLDIELARPDASLLSALTMAFAAPVCASSGRVASLKKPALPCGAGAFRVTRFEAGQIAVLTRFTSYHEPSVPRLEGVEITFGVAFRTQRYLFEARQIDIVSELSPVDSARFAAAASWATGRAWVRTPVSFGIFLNTELRPFDNRHLRRAVAFGIDREQIAKLNPQIEASDHIVPAMLLSPPPGERRRLRADRPAALREMALAGHPFDPATGEGGYPYEIPYLTVVGTFEQAAAEVFQQQLARIGIRIRLELLSWPAYLDQISTRGRAVMGWRGWGADYPDPSTFFEPTLSSHAIAERGGQNVSFFSDPTLDALLRKADREPVRRERMQLFRRVEMLVAREAPWIPVYAPRALHVWHAHVRHYEPSKPGALERVSLELP